MANTCVYVIPQPLLEQLLFTGVCLSSDVVPRDADIRSVNGEWQTNSLCIVAEHPLYAPVPDGAAPPRVILSEFDLARSR